MPGHAAWAFFNPSGDMGFTAVFTFDVAFRILVLQRKFWRPDSWELVKTKQTGFVRWVFCWTWPFLHYMLKYVWFFGCSLRESLGSTQEIHTTGSWASLTFVFWWSMTPKTPGQGVHELRGRLGDFCFFGGSGLCCFGSAHGADSVSLAADRYLAPIPWMFWIGEELGELKIWGWSEIWSSW